MRERRERKEERKKKEKRFSRGWNTTWYREKKEKEKKKEKKKKKKKEKKKRWYSPLVILRRTRSFSQEAKEASRASVIFLLVPGVNGGTCAGISVTHVTIRSSASKYVMIYLFWEIRVKNFFDFVKFTRIRISLNLEFSVIFVWIL